MQHHINILANGISLVLVPIENVASVTTIVMMGVGSRYESDNQQGLAHFTEHMVFKGGKKYPTAQAVAQALDAVGGEFNAFTSSEFTAFFTKTASEHLDLGLDVLADMTLRASFPEEELKKEKGVIVEEINMYEDIPMRDVDGVLMSLVYGDTPMGRPITGSKKSVKAFSREDFVNYVQQFYQGEKCTIVLAGNMDLQEAQQKVENYFNSLPKGSVYQPQSAIFIPKAGIERVKIKEKKSEQTHLLLAAQAYALTDPKRDIFRLLSVILGGNMSSRLFVSVREEQGLCYYIRATPDVYTDSGMLVASAGVDNTRLEQAVAAIIQEMSKLKNERVEETELERAKQFILGKLQLSLEDTEQVAEFYGGQQLLEGKIRNLSQMRASILSVRPDQIQAAAGEIFQTDRLRLAVIGPQNNRAKLAELLVI
jgi:predicted Zn-dependent peptidase